MATQSGSIAFRTATFGTVPLAPSKTVLRPAAVLAGRVLFSLIFLLAASGHFSHQEIAYAAQQGVPLASLAVPLSGVLALVGGLSVLLGYQAKWGAGLLIVFLVPVTLYAAQFLGSERSDDGSDADGHVPEKPVHDRRGFAHHPVRCRAPEPGRAQPSLNRACPRRGRKWSRRAAPDASRGSPFTGLLVARMRTR